MKTGSFFPRQELPRTEIYSILNQTEFLNETVEDETAVVVVLRHTELYINFSYNNIFSLLYKFLVMQVASPSSKSSKTELLKNYIL